RRGAQADGVTRRRGHFRDRRPPVEAGGRPLCPPPARSRYRRAGLDGHRRGDGGGRHGGRGGGGREDRPALGPRGRTSDPVSRRGRDPARFGADRDRSRAPGRRPARARRSPQGGGVSARGPLAHAWWLAGRSAGVVAFLLLTISVVAGLAMALRVVPPRGRPALRAGHERIALAALAAVGAHGLLLLGDPWLKLGLDGLLVPFVAGYRAFWTGLGVCAGYVAAALALSYYARRRVGARRWRKAHRLIPIAWGLAAVHVLGSG